MNTIWTSRFNKTRSLSTLNTSAGELVKNIEWFKRSQIPQMFSNRNHMIGFKKSYEYYHLEKYGAAWSGDILDKFYLQDLKESIENIYTFQNELNPEL